MPGNLPVLGICGWSGSGKTTLIEQVLPHLLAQGLKVAVVKHDAHHIDVDRPGKDSHRLFEAGADVVLHADQGGFFRTHEGSQDVRPLLCSLASRYDLVLVEGHKPLPVPKVWLLSEGESAPPAEVGEILSVLPQKVDRRQQLIAILERFLPRLWLKTPVLGCVLIGGKSSRMGRPKHLLRKSGKTWLQRTVESLLPLTERVVVLGKGAVPDGLKGLVRLDDVPDAAGPMAGLLSAMRWAPRASWLVAACDLPELTPEAMSWLLSTRRPGAWATVPVLSGQAQPLLAHYDFRARCLLEDLAAVGNHRLSDIVASSKVTTPTPPAELEMAWRNVNTPDELEAATTSK